MPTAQKNQSTRRNDRGRGLASRLPAAARGPLGRVGSEAEDVWKEARALSRRSVSTEQIHADVVYAAWYAGLAAMTALRVIEWQLAAVIAGAHTVERYGRRQIVREMAGGLDAGI
jgi:hypothetical protein